MNNKQDKKAYKMCFIAGGVGIFFIFILGLSYYIFGHQFLESIYNERSMPFFNQLMNGRQARQLNSYFDIADVLTLRVLFPVLAGFWIVTCLILLPSVRRCLRYFSKKPETIAVIIGIFSSMVLFAVAETSLRISNINRLGFTRTYNQSYFIWNDDGVLQASQGLHQASSVNKHTGEIIFNVTYSVDQFGRRITPVNHYEERIKPLLFFGGSFTYGEGVQDNETLPYYVAKEMPDYMPYNYGFHGLGPFDVVAKLETIDFDYEIEENAGIVIYTFIDDHIGRVNGNTANARWLSDRAYYHITRDGNMVRRGSFIMARPFLMLSYRFLANSRVLRALNISFPPSVTTRHVEKTARVLQQMNFFIKKKLPQSTFYVLFYPGRSMYSGRLIPYLHKAKINYFDYSKLFEGESLERYILDETDKHPNAYAYQKISDILSQDLRGFAARKPLPRL